jgi:hypothetical protein
MIFKFLQIQWLFSQKNSDQISLVIFTFHICAKFQTKKKKKKAITCVFECFQSHCHILKELHEFLHMMGAITIFEKN